MFKAGFIKVDVYFRFDSDIHQESWIHVDSIEKITKAEYPPKESYKTKIETNSESYMWCQLTDHEILTHIDFYRKGLLS